MSSELSISSSKIAALTQDPGIYTKELQQQRLQWAQLGQERHKMIQGEAARYAGQTLGFEMGGGGNNGWNEFGSVESEVECWSDFGGVICTAIIDAVLNNGEYCVEIKPKNGNSLKKHHLLQLIINGRILFDNVNKYPNGLLHLYDLRGKGDVAFIYPNCGYQHWDDVSKMAYYAAVVYDCQSRTDYIKSIKKDKTLFRKSDLIPDAEQELKRLGQSGINNYRLFMELYKNMNWQVADGNIICDV